jgi:hypothetical protein
MQAMNDAALKQARGLKLDKAAVRRAYVVQSLLVVTVSCSSKTSLVAWVAVAQLAG